MQRRLLTVVVPVAAGLLVAGCGSASQERSDAQQAQSVAKKATTDLSVDADPSGDLKFNKSELAAKSGGVTIKMSNPATIPHGVAVTGNGVDKVGQTVSKGGTSTVSANLKPGKYEFFCPVPGHRQGGMKGTLTVT